MEGTLRNGSYLPLEPAQRGRSVLLAGPFRCCFAVPESFLGKQRNPQFFAILMHLLYPVRRAKGKCAAGREGVRVTHQLLRSSSPGSRRGIPPGSSWNTLPGSPEQQRLVWGSGFVAFVFPVASLFSKTTPFLIPIIGS